jgi:cell division protein FtsI (penicillin-binding protein 3)
MLMLLLCVAATTILSARMMWMGVAASVRSDKSSGVSPVPVRADIVDRNGVPLARNIDAYAVAVHPNKIMGDRAELAARLHGIFPDQSQAYFYGVLTSKKGWAYLRRRALPEEVAAVNALGQVAIEFPREKERLYPQRTLAAHLIGFTGIDGHGGMGVERAFDDRLIDARMRGAPLMLSVDARVQGALEEEMAKGVAIQSAKGAAGIVLDTRNGEVLAMASLPTFNPNKLETTYNPNATCEQSSRCNRVVQARYELGSTFKPLSIGAAMDAGVVTSMSKTYDATAPLEVGRFRIKDDHPLGRWINVPETLVHSSNIATARIADEMGSLPLQKAFRALEFDRRSSVELKERAGTLWPSNWGRLTNMTVSYGHGIAVTPMHLASAYAALVNGGVFYPATVLKRQVGDEPQGRRVFTAATSARMRQLLRMIVDAGTGRSANAEGYRVGGKTGSAEKPHNGGYAHRSLIATFAAAFPMENPRYVVIVMMDEPQGSAEHPGLRTAAWTAAPVLKAFIERVGPMLNVYPEANRDIDISELMPLLHGDKETE